MISKTAELMRRIPPEDHHITEEFIDMVKLHEPCNRYGVSLVLHRAYRRAAERLDLISGEPGWVKFRQALQGVE